MPRFDKVLAIVFFAFAAAIAVSMLNGRPPLAVSTGALDYVFNGLMAFVLIALSIMYWHAEDRRIFNSKPAFNTTSRTCMIAGLASIVVGGYLLIEPVQNYLSTFG